MAENGDPPTDFSEHPEEAQQDFATDDANYGAFKKEEPENFGEGGIPDEALGEENVELREESGYGEAEDIKEEIKEEEEEDYQSAEIEPTGRDYTSSEYYQQMLSYGIAEPVIGELIEMIDSGKFSIAKIAIGKTRCWFDVFF